MNQFPIDLTAPGGLEQLFAFHRAQFGDATMSVNAGTEDPPNDQGANGQGDGQNGQQNIPKPTPPAAPEDDDEQLGDGGKKALKAERDARTKAEKDLADARAELQKIEDAKLSDIDRANKTAQGETSRADELQRKLWRADALVAHPVSEDYRHLVTGTDEESYLASAKSISELEAAANTGPKRGYVGASGTNGGDPNPSGGSVAAGREAFAAKHKSKD